MITPNIKDEKYFNPKFFFFLFLLGFLFFFVLCVCVCVCVCKNMCFHLKWCRKKKNT